MEALAPLVTRESLKKLQNSTVCYWTKFEPTHVIIYCRIIPWRKFDSHGWLCWRVDKSLNHSDPWLYTTRQWDLCACSWLVRRQTTKMTLSSDKALRHDDKILSRERKKKKKIYYSCGIEPRAPSLARGRKRKVCRFTSERARFYPASPKFIRTILYESSRTLVYFFELMHLGIRVSEHDSGALAGYTIHLCILAQVLQMFFVIVIYFSLTILCRATLQRLEDDFAIR